MQTAALTTPSNAYQSFTNYSRLTTYERRDLSVSYTDGQRSVHLSLSQEVLTDTVIYSKTGAPVRQPLPSPSSETTDETSGTGSMLIDDAFERYAELIADRVDYLLQRIAEARQQIAGNTDGTNSDVSGTILYAEQTSVVTSSLNIEASALSALDYSPEATAERIVDFALSFYDGGDRAAYAAKIKAAVMKGFEQALGAMGGTLPQASYDTIDLAMSAIDQWVQAGMDVTA